MHRKATKKHVSVMKPTAKRVSAQVSADGKEVVVRLVNTKDAPMLVSVASSGPGSADGKLTAASFSTIWWPDLKGANTPGEPTKIAPTEVQPADATQHPLDPQSYTTLVLRAHQA